MLFSLRHWVDLQTWNCCDILIKIQIMSLMVFAQSVDIVQNKL